MNITCSNAAQVALPKFLTNRDRIIKKEIKTDRNFTEQGVRAQNIHCVAKCEQNSLACSFNSLQKHELAEVTSQLIRPQQGKSFSKQHLCVQSFPCLVILLLNSTHITVPRDTSIYPLSVSDIPLSLSHGTHKTQITTKPLCTTRCSLSRQYHSVDKEIFINTLKKEILITSYDAKIANNVKSQNA